MQLSTKKDIIQQSIKSIHSTYNYKTKSMSQSYNIKLINFINNKHIINYKSVYYLETDV